jgi:hypothetical protein
MAWIVIWGGRNQHIRQVRKPKRDSEQRTKAVAKKQRMKQLGRLKRYLKELAKITKASHLPSQWTTPEQRCYRLSARSN